MTVTLHFRVESAQQLTLQGDDLGHGFAEVEMVATATGPGAMQTQARYLVTDGGTGEVLFLAVGGKQAVETKGQAIAARLPVATVAVASR